ncbi:RING-H2 finger protein ATL78-like [Lolium perenne]|uniref:RING-H2 finger protein ATL78-like n=1 Tax=Lolium perenne TaxID=4522 RepID=UPI0021F63790|nr:RING-H2 finger protein ATL74-like [Lolium perenne]
MGRPDTDAPPSSVAAWRAVHGHAHGGGRVDAAPAPAADDSAFDTNVVIILAALFFALICVIGLNSLARCALRCGGRGGAAAAEGDGVASARASRRGGGGGIKRRVLRSLPVEVYGGGGEGIDDVCAICLGEFVDGEKVRVLPRCGHGFHVRCVDAWLVSHGSCPTCRRLVIEGAPAKGDGCGQSRRPAETDTIAVVIV